MAFLVFSHYFALSVLDLIDSAYVCRMTSMIDSMLLLQHAFLNQIDFVSQVTSATTLLWRCMQRANGRAWEHLTGTV